jgi:hypothetical protein
MFYIDIRILINAGTLAPSFGLQIGFPNFMVFFSLFFCLGANTRPKVVQHLLVTWGRLKNNNNILASTPSVKAIGVG